MSEGAEQIMTEARKQGASTSASWTSYVLDY